MRYARPVVLDAEQRAQLEQQARARSLPARMVERSKIVLLAAEGKPDLEIARNWASLRRKRHAGETGSWTLE